MSGIATTAGSDHGREIIIPPAGSLTVGRKELEIVGGFKVHPMASTFPLIEGKEFEQFVDAIAAAGTLAPVEFNGGLLIDGRNRVRAVEELRRRGIEIALPTVDWEPTDGETVEMHIFSVNFHRRHLTEDQRVAIGLAFLPFIRRTRQENQAATRFGQRHPVTQNSSPPADPGNPKRSSREKDAASSVGQLAAVSRVGRHKASQAAALQKAVDAGEISPDVVGDVIAGGKRLRDVVPNKRQSTKKKAAPREGAPPAPAQAPDVGGRDVEKFDEPPPTEQAVRERWERLKRPFAVADHREVRRLLRQIIVEEQRQFDH